MIDQLTDLAFAHHWLVRHRGGERVLRALRTIAPQAPIYTLLRDPQYTAGPDFRLGPDDNAPVITSWLDRIPGAIDHYPRLLPLMPLAARSLHPAPVKMIIVSDAALAKAMRFHRDTRVLCYCHSPMRYVWDLEHAYREQIPVPLRPLWPLLATRLRRVDRRAADRVDRFIANSRTVAERIRRHYGRDAIVIHPPVDVPDAPPPTAPRDDFFLCVGHHTPYKRLDLAVRACRQLGRRLVVIGDGPDVNRLKTDSTGVEWLGRRSDAEVRQYLRRASALLFPGEEDFGIVPVEAQAHGCPVIAFGRGGATETVIDGRTGLFFSDQSLDSLVDAIARFDRLTFDPVLLHAHAAHFRTERFLEQTCTLVNQEISLGRRAD